MVSDHLDLELPILCLYSVNGQICLMSKYKCQETRFPTACQYPWITGSLVS